MCVSQKNLHDHRNVTRRKPRVSDIERCASRVSVGFHAGKHAGARQSLDLPCPDSRNIRVSFFVGVEQQVRPAGHHFCRISRGKARGGAAELTPSLSRPKVVEVFWLAFSSDFTTKAGRTPAKPAS